MIVQIKNILPAHSDCREDICLFGDQQCSTAHKSSVPLCSEQRIKSEVTHDTILMMEQYFDPKFNALAERVDMILEKLDTKVDKEDCENSMSVVATAVRAHSRDIDELKAQ